MKKYALICLLLLITLSACQQAIDHMMRDLPGQTHSQREIINQDNQQSFIQSNIDGNALFAANCASCHHPIKDATGPNLRRVDQRWPDKAKLREFVRDSRKMISSGDKYSIELYQKWNKVRMPAFPDLTDAEIDAVLRYTAGCSLPSSL